MGEMRNVLVVIKRNDAIHRIFVEISRKKIDVFEFVKSVSGESRSESDLVKGLLKYVYPIDRSFTEQFRLTLNPGYGGFDSVVTVDICHDEHYTKLPTFKVKRHKDIGAYRHHLGETAASKKKGFFAKLLG